MSDKAPLTMTVRQRNLSAINFLKSNAVILSISINGEAVKEARPGDDVLIILNRTPFLRRIRRASRRHRRNHKRSREGDRQRYAKNSSRCLGACRNRQRRRAKSGRHRPQCGGRLPAHEYHLQSLGGASHARRLATSVRQPCGTTRSLIAPDHLRFDFSHNAAINTRRITQNRKHC